MPRLICTNHKGDAQWVQPALGLDDTIDEVIEIAHKGYRGRYWHEDYRRAVLIYDSYDFELQIAKKLKGDSP